MGREERIAVFRDTEAMCRTCPRLKESICRSREGQRLILGKDRLDVPPPCDAAAAGRVILSKKRTFEAASQYARTMKTCVLNFASASNPGGGVVHGSNAQEEALCRCSTLYFNLIADEMAKGFYEPHRTAKNPVHNNDAIFTPRVTVFKSDTDFPATLPESEWYEVDVISCAAPNLRRQPSNEMNSGDGDNPVVVSPEELRTIHESRLARILDIAAANGEEAVILGAFGCGAFRNDPKVVSAAAAAVVSRYGTRFKVIEFAVFCRPEDTRNHDAFESAFA